MRHFPPHDKNLTQTDHDGQPTRDDAATAVQRIRNNRAALERVADSDLPCSWVAETLLAVADDHDTDAGLRETTGGDDGGGDAGR
jgi:hypothetical protein